MAEPDEVVVETADACLQGTLSLPDDASGLVVFAHGSGSSRKSPRNRFVAEELRGGGMGTLLFDLLTPAEEQVDLHTRLLRFDIPLLARRLVGAIDWLAEHPDTRGLPLATFGASTGAAAALIAATERPELVRAVVSRGGRPDLAGEALGRVRVPALFLVGGNDMQVLALNEKARARMSVPAHIQVVPGASHLFEEPGTLEEVARLARRFLQLSLAPAGRASRTA
jgi:pimeloyl-ACP methyl ester carboxylesterase